MPRGGKIDLTVPKIDFVDLDKVGDIAFGKRGSKEPKFLPFVRDLMKADGKAAILPNPKYKQSVMAAANKVGVALLFGEKEGKLYVRLLKAHREATQIRDLIMEKPRTAAELGDIMHNRGSSMNVREELQMLSSANVIKLGSESRWEITNFGKTWEPASTNGKK